MPISYEELGLNEDQQAKINAHIEALQSGFQEKEIELEKKYHAKGAGKAYQNVTDTVLEITGLKKSSEDQKESDYIKEALGHKINAEREAAKIKYSKGGIVDNAAYEALKQKYSLVENELNDYKTASQKQEEQKAFNEKVDVLKKGLPKFSLDEKITKPHVDAILNEIVGSGELINEINGKIYVGNKSIDELLENNSIFVDVLKQHVSTNENDGVKGLDLKGTGKGSFTSIDAIAAQAKTKSKEEQMSFTRNSIVEMLINKGFKRHSPEYQDEYAKALTEIKGKI